MKRKLTTLVLALAMIMCFSVSSFAASTESDGNGSALVTKLTYTGATSAANSSYTVTVPASITVGAAVPTSNNVTIQGYCTQKVSVSAKSTTVTMTSTGKNTLSANITLATVTMPATVISSGSTGGKISAAWPTDGVPTVSSWSGSIGYNVTLS